MVYGIVLGFNHQKMMLFCLCLLTECPKMILSDFSWMDEHLQTLPHTEKYTSIAYFCVGIHTITEH